MLPTNYTAVVVHVISFTSSGPAVANIKSCQPCHLGGFNLIHVSLLTPESVVMPQNPPRCVSPTPTHSSPKTSMPTCGETIPAHNECYGYYYNNLYEGRSRDNPKEGFLKYTTAVPDFAYTSTQTKIPNSKKRYAVSIHVSQ